MTEGEKKIMHEIVDAEGKEEEEDALKTAEERGMLDLATIRRD